MSESKPSNLIYVTGDLFSAPPGSILVHACNTQGSWGAGIAAAFRTKFPSHYESYQNTCKQHGADLLGTCLVIRGEGLESGSEYDIACLFTSKAYGRRKDKPELILQSTRSAVEDLILQNSGEMKPLHAWYLHFSAA